MRHDIKHRGHRIIASDHTGRPQAVVLVGRTQVTPERIEEKTLAEAIVAAKAWIGARLADAHARQRAPHVATAARYEEFLASHDLRPYERAMLVAHAEHQVLTATQLAQAAGWSTYHPANSYYGMLGQAAADFLELTLVKRKDGSDICTTSLAQAADESIADDSPYFQWAIHPELAKAVAAAGLVERPAWLAA